MSYTMWRKCHKVIIEVRSLAKGDMYFGELSPAEMTICVKSNQTGHQYTCQLKKKKIKEERLFSKLSVQFCNLENHQVGGEQALNLQQSGHPYQFRRLVCLNFSLKLKCLCQQHASHLEVSKFLWLFLVSNPRLHVNISNWFNLFKNRFCKQ